MDIQHYLKSEKHTVYKMEEIDGVLKGRVIEAIEGFEHALHELLIVDNETGEHLGMPQTLGHIEAKEIELEDRSHPLKPERGQTPHQPLAEKATKDVKDVQGEKKTAQSAEKTDKKKQKAADSREKKQEEDEKRFLGKRKRMIDAEDKKRAQVKKETGGS
jgi:hypothetical protein